MVESKYFNSGQLSKYPLIKTEQEFERFVNYADKLPMPEWPEGKERNLPDFEATLKCLLTTEIYNTVRDKYEKYDIQALGIVGNVLKKNDAYMLNIEKIDEYFDFEDAEGHSVAYDLEAELMGVARRIMEKDPTAEAELKELLKKNNLKERSLFLMVASKTDQQPEV